MSQIFSDIQSILAKYTDTPVADFSMSDDLDLNYDMDSTELTEVAKLISQKYGVSIAKSDRADWSTGNDIVAFLQRAMPGVVRHTAVQG